MEPQGVQLIAGVTSTDGPTTFSTHDPAAGSALEPLFADATDDEVAAAVTAAVAAADELRQAEPAVLAALLRAAATRLEAAGDELVERADRETRLGRPRLPGELARTCGQLRLFAEVVEDGAYLDVTIDHADPDATPPRPDLRRMQLPLGPVAVFGASNFPLAFGVAGGDTASAWAAGCPVIAKPHPSNAGTGELVARCLTEAVAEVGLPPGTFSLVQGAGTEVGTALVTAPGVAAVGFTGSLGGGRALFDLAAARPEPIPVYAEMGSTNPVWVAPAALAQRGAEIAAGFVASMMLGNGQFCTKPGIVFLPEGPDAEAFIASAAEALTAVVPGPLLDERIAAAFTATAGSLVDDEGVEVVARAEADGDGWRGSGMLLRCDVATWLARPALREECFGPLGLVVHGDVDELLAAATRIESSITATIHSDPDDLEVAAALRDRLVSRVGRLIHDGFSTGVPVTWAMHHGGPYPATTAPLHTSVGATAIRRFLRPITFQDVPSSLLPPTLRDDALERLPRRVDGALRLPDHG